MKLTNRGHLKAGNVEGSIGAIVTLVIGLGVAILAFILVFTMGGNVFQLVEPSLASFGGQVNNCTITITNGTNTTLCNAHIVPSSFLIRNKTGALVTTNYTLFAGRGIIYKYKDPHHFKSGASAFVYYKWGDANMTDNIRESVKSGFAAGGTVMNYLPIIVLAVIIGIVLSLIMGFGGMGTMRGGGSAL
jgi:hypothetical protein